MAKQSRGSVLLLVSALGLCSMLTVAPSHAAVGRTAGSFSVSNSGSATYAIPIFVPPAPQGLQPSIALVYNSNVGVGTLGRGWSISGFSSISRCGKTISQDGVVDGINANFDSPFCLDGNRLRHTGGSSYGTSGSVYMTEIADFSRITLGANAGSWTVERKDGLIYTYGGTSNSVVEIGSIVEWKLSEIRDRAGNKIRFTWKTPESPLTYGATTVGTTHPTKIEWTQTSAGSGVYVNKMDFIYTTGGNAPASTPTGYLFQTKVEDSDLLVGITVSVDGTLKRNYVLEYESSPATFAKRLRRVKECSDSGPTPSDCLAPTEFTYQNGAAMNTSSPALTVSNVMDANGEYDLDGNGIKDIAYQSSADNKWYVRFASASGTYEAPVATNLTSFNPGKLLGKPAAQLLAVSGGTWYVYDWNTSCSCFSGTSTGITVAASSADIVIADVDGDGRDDLNYVAIGTPVTVANWHVPQVKIYARKNTSSGGSLSFASPSWLFWNWDLGPVVLDGALPPSMPVDIYDYLYYGFGIYQAAHAAWLTKGGDYNRDGRQELNLHLTVHTGYYYPLGTIDYNQGVLTDTVEQVHTVLHDATGNIWVATTGDGWSNWLPAAVLPADINNDGCADVNLFEYGIALSTCQWVPFQALPIPATLGAWMGSSVAFGDWTGDGVDDVLYAGGTEVGVLPSMGGAFGSAIATGILTGGSSKVVVTDGNGDDLDDIGVLESNSLKVYRHTGTLAVPDLLTEVEDGFGVIHEVEYTAIARGSYTASSGAVHPYQDVKGDMHVVSTVTAPDGAGGTYQTTYAYHGAIKHLEGRGFLGFARIESVDSRTGIKHERQFEQEFPKTGMLKAEKFYQPAASGGHLISSKTITVSSTTLDPPNNQRYFSYPSTITEDVYEVDGAKNTDLITHTEVSNTFDTSGNLTASTRTVTDKDTSSPLYTYAWVRSSSTSFSPNTTYWCLGLPTATSVTDSTTTGEASVTRSKSFTPDYINCRMDAESIEPASSTLRVDASYGYDAFGNVNSVSVTGRNPNGTSMTARTASTSWGTTGQFPVSETNALGQTTTRTFHPTFGSLLTETDPNGIVVVNNPENYHDGFGRITRSYRPDGTYTVYTYYDCVSYGSCLNGDPASGATGINKVVVVATERDASDGDIRNSVVHMDQFDRPIVELSQTIAGSSYNRIGRQYDTLGRVYRETAPCSSGNCTAYWTTNTYDLLGRLAQQSRPRSEGDATAVTTTLAYAGRTQTVTDANNKVTTKVLDVNGWMRRSRDHDNYGQNFSYDAAGSLVGVSDTASNALFSASYNYGAKPLQYSTTDMDLGAWSYSYSSLGELVSWTDAKSQSFSQTYDALSRVTSRTEYEGTTTWTWGTNSGSHNIGRLAGVSMTGYSEALSYDSVGRLSTRSVTADGNTYDIDTAYNNQGLLDTLTYPTSTASTRVKVKYGYAYGILQSVTDWTSGSAGTVYWTANAKSFRGQTTQETLGNGVVTLRNFDPVTGWLNSIQSGISGGTGLQNHSYAYDKIGFVTQRQAYVGATPLTESFYPDNLYRLDYSTLNNGGGTFTNLDLTYDAMGNITSRSDVNGNATWTYDGSRKHAVTSTGTGGATFGYDANGNMTSRDGQTINWTSYNYPSALATATESTTFTYGPDRQYYKQDYSGPSGSETTYYIGGLLEKVSSGGVTDWRHYIVAEGQTVAIVSRKSTGTNAVNYPLEDHQSSSSVLTDSSGTGTVRASYNAFGLPRDGSDWDGAAPSGDLTTIESITRRGYTGHSMLGRMGLIHMNGRVQDAETGRFLSPDPYVNEPGFTQGFNRFAYVNNNPLSYIDPSGFCREKQLRDGAAEGRRWNQVLSDRQAALSQMYAQYAEHQQLAAQYLAYIHNGAVLPPNVSAAQAAAYYAWAVRMVGDGNGTLGQVPVFGLPDIRPQDLPPIYTTICDGIDWEQKAKDWWPGYQLGTCIYEFLTGGKCGGGTWVAGIVGAVPLPAAKGAQAAARGAANRAASRAQGIPDSMLGPSGLPKRHTVEHSSKKEAREAAQLEVGPGGRVRNDASPTDPRQGPHYQAEDVRGRNVQPVVHHEYPE